MLQFENVSTFYGKIQALHSVNVEVRQGEIVTLIGANGAGKSTLMMTLCGSPQAHSGSIRYLGEELVGLSSAHIMRKSIAVVPEGRRVFARLTVEENLAMGGFFTDKHDYQEQMDKVLHLFPRLKERFTQRGGTMSGGEQQMLAIGRALMSKPKLLLLDEPSLGLAPIIIQQLFTGALHYNPAVFQHIGTVCNFQCLVGVLFHQKHRHTLTAQLFDDVENLLNDDRCEPQ